MKTQLYVSEKKLWEKYSWNNFEKSVFSGIRRKFSGSLPNNFQQSRQNFILRVQKNIFLESIVSGKKLSLAFSDFRRIFRAVSQTFFAEFSKHALYVSREKTRWKLNFPWIFFHLQHRAKNLFKEICRTFLNGF